MTIKVNHKSEAVTTKLFAADVGLYSFDSIIIIIIIIIVFNKSWQAQPVQNIDSEIYNRLNDSLASELRNSMSVGGKGR